VTLSGDPEAIGRLLEPLFPGLVVSPIGIITGSDYDISEVVCSFVFVPCLEGARSPVTAEIRAAVLNNNLV